MRELLGDLAAALWAEVRARLRPQHVLVAVMLVGGIIGWSKLMQPHDPRGPDPRAAAAASISQVIPPVEPPDEAWGFLGKHGNLRFVWVDREFIEQEWALKGVAASLDPADDQYCQIHFWRDRKLVPQGNWPMTEQQVEGQVAIYSRNPATGQRAISWADGRETRY